MWGFGVLGICWNFSGRNSMQLFLIFLILNFANFVMRKNSRKSSFLTLFKFPLGKFFNFFSFHFFCARVGYLEFSYPICVMYPPRGGIWGVGKNLPLEHSACHPESPLPGDTARPRGQEGMSQGPCQPAYHP